MSGPKIHYASVIEDSPLVIMDRVVGISGAAITQATLTGIAFRAFEYASQEEAESDTEQTEVGTSETLTVSSVIFDTLQTAAPWDSSKEATGYNFRTTIPAARFPNGGKWVAIEVTFDPVSGEDFCDVWIVNVLHKRGS